ncbi:MAG: tripartite tricarboxylate transporter TctB family protein, partial [Gammaproteobacteria bacterium]
MGKLRTGHLVEAGLWLCLCLFLYTFSFQFERPIEIYKFGASAWPRAIILLMAIAALGQLYHQWKYGDETST